MFTPDERKILRGRAPGQRAARDSLVVRLANAMTFRRAPRDSDSYIQPPIGCINIASMAEHITKDHYRLPAMTKGNLEKAHQLMNSATLAVPRHLALKSSSGVTAEKLLNIIRIAGDVWTARRRDKVFADIFRHIPNFRLIRRVVCIGLSEIAKTTDPETGKVIVMSQSLAQHLAVISMVFHLENLIGHSVGCFAASWEYDRAHEQALEKVSFTILDPLYGKQEHFVGIDDHTLLISFSTASFESVLPIISEYARPVAIICDPYDYMINRKCDRPPPSPTWSQVKYKGDWVPLPGPPLIGAEPVQGPGGSNSSNPTSIWRPFYTDSAGAMLNEYQMRMKLSDMDLGDLPNRFDLHPDVDQSNRHGDVPQQKCFVSPMSCLLVRKWC
ncbi:hypothetical protein F4777DRAFT_590010 [Nemania sp. FL0916]|nr:hypothetical protein F4777DRAFT_590010 [Nemania sp. FL0916]